MLVFVTLFGILRVLKTIINFLEINTMSAFNFNVKTLGLLGVLTVVLFQAGLAQAEYDWDKRIQNLHNRSDP